MTKRVRHKNTNTAEAPDSEQKAPTMQHKACSPFRRSPWRFINCEGLLTARSRYHPATAQEHQHSRSSQQLSAEGSGHIAAQGLFLGLERPVEV